MILGFIKVICLCWMIKPSASFSKVPVLHMKLLVLCLNRLSFQGSHMGVCQNLKRVNISLAQWELLLLEKSVYLVIDHQY